MKIAVSGKGGSGKTTLSATLSRTFARHGFPVLAIDGDPNPNLGTALGLDAPHMVSLHPLPRDIIEERVAPSGEKSVALAEPLESITSEHGVVGPDGVTLLMTGRVEHAGAGWLCGAHATVRGMLGQLMERADRLTIVDMEASVEHMSRGTVRHTDVILVVTEPYYRSLETAGRVATLARELGIPRVYVVANKVRSAQDEEAIRRYCAEHDLEVAAVLHFDEDVLQADNAGKPVLDLHPQAEYIASVEKLADWLQPQSARQTAIK